MDSRTNNEDTTRESGTMTISEAFDAYRLDVIVFKNQSSSTEENHYVCLKNALDYFGDIEVSKITFEDVRDWKIRLEKNRSAQTVRNYIIRLRVVLAYLNKRGIPTVNAELIPIPKCPEQKVHFLSKEEVAHLIDNTNQMKNKAIMSMLYASGVRVSELCGLDRDSVRPDNTFTVVGKGGYSRLCFIDERTKVYLNLYLKERLDNNPALFLTAAGLRVSPGTIQATFKTARDRAGFKHTVSPHWLRHSFACNLLQSNCNLYYVSRLLGHKNLDTTRTYLHAVDEDLKQIYYTHHTT